MSPVASGQTGPLRHAWLIPAGLAAAAVGLLCWGAWVYGYDALYFARSPAWLRDTLQTDQNWTPLVTMALLLSGLGLYWWPRRRKNIPIGLIAVLVLALVAAALGAAADVPCRGRWGSPGVSSR